MIIVCMLADKVAVVAAGSVMNQSCPYCNRRVTLAPTSQRLLKERSDTEIICVECVVKQGIPEDTPIGLAGPAEDVAREMDNVVPNPWLGRN